MDIELLNRLKTAPNWELLDENEWYSLVLWDTEDESKFNINKKDNIYTIFIYDDTYNTWEEIPSSEIQEDLEIIFNHAIDTVANNTPVEEPPEEKPTKRNVATLLANTKKMKPEGWDKEENIEKVEGKNNEIKSKKSEF